MVEAWSAIETVIQWLNVNGGVVSVVAVAVAFWTGKQTPVWAEMYRRRAFGFPKLTVVPASASYAFTLEDVGDPPPPGASPHGLENTRYVRLTIQNTGTGPATNCKAWVTAISSENRTLQYEDVIRLQPSYMPTDKGDSPGVQLPAAIRMHFDIVAHHEHSGPRIQFLPRGAYDSQALRDILDPAGSFTFTIHVSCDELPAIEAHAEVHVGSEWESLNLIRSW